MTEGTKKAIKEKIFRLKATRRTLELKQALTPGERAALLDCIDNYIFLLESKDEPLEQKKEEPNG